MRLMAIRSIVPAALFGMMLFALPVQQSLSQDRTDTYQLKRVEVAVQSSPSSPVPVQQVATRAVPAANTAIYLPLSLLPPRFGPVQFAASANDNGLINPATTFAFGLQTIYFGSLAEGFPVGTPYRIEFTFPAISGETSTIINDTTIANPDNIFYSFRIVDRITNQPTGDPLPRGAYTVRIFVNNVLQQQGTATIQ